MRGYCKVLYDSFGGLSLEEFTGLLKRVVYEEPDIQLLVEQVDREAGTDRSFAKRLITGQAAEQYFRSNYKGIGLFKNLELEDTTRLGCGFDFRLASPSVPSYAVEVKGLEGTAGSIVLTDKEHSVAAILKSRFVLFVVKNFRESPFHELHQDPLGGRLTFTRVERRVVQVNWTTNL